ncbi:MAG: glycosyltransferase family 39 protein [Polyangiaceae bacterium]|nr:glycosyltransferase family 39 protein [Polyangiaceae bacterium]
MRYVDLSGAIGLVGRLLASTESRGVAGVICVYLALGMSHAFTVTPFLPIDERAHVGYALSISRGELPEVRTRLQTRELGLRRSGRYSTVWLANHPPLYYVLVAAPVRWGVQTGDVTAGVRLARMVSVVLGALGLIQVYRCVRLLLPRHPAVALAGAAFTGTVPGFVHICSLVHNDALAFFATASSVLASLAVLIRGPTPPGLLRAAFWLTVAALTRFSGLLSDAVLLLALAGAFVLHGRGPVWRRAALGCLGSGATAACVALASGWFYARNYSLYGDIAGTKATLTLFKRVPHGTALDGMTDPGNWLSVLDGAFGRLGGGFQLTGVAAEIPRLFAAAAAIGLLVLLVRTRSRFRVQLLGEPRTWGVLSCLALLCGVTLSLFVYRARGGSLHARYLYPALWVAASASAAGLACLRSALPLKLGVVLLTLFNLLVLDEYLLRTLRLTKLRDFVAYEALARGGVDEPGPWILAGLLLLCYGLITSIDAIGVTHRRLE